MTLKEAITTCDDKFYCDSKLARHCDSSCPPTSDEFVAKRRIEAWDYIKERAQLSVDLEAQVEKIFGGIQLEELLDLRQENDELRGHITRYQSALQAAGLQIAVLQAEKVELAMRLHNG